LLVGKSKFERPTWWIKPIILAIQEAELRRITSPGTNVILYPQNNQNKKGRGVWLKWWSIYLVSFGCLKFKS
jgi:hypothetical protein